MRIYPGKPLQFSKFAFIFITILLCVSRVSSQNVRIHLTTGLSNYYGELQGKKLTFSQSNPVFGLGATLGITEKLLLRGDFSVTKLEADDKNGFFPYRNLNFKTNVQEGNLLLEYDLRSLSNHVITPYVFSGVGLFHFNSYSFDSLNNKVYLRDLSTEGQGFPEFPDRKVVKKSQWNIPIGGGIKYAISDDVQFGFEYGLRILFTDHLDDVSTSYVNEELLLNRKGPVAVAMAFRGDEIKGNPKTYPGQGTFRGSSRINDFYYYGLARLSIRMQWFENGAGISNGRRNLKCPTRVF